MLYLQATLLILTLLTASFLDIKTHTLPDGIHIVLLLIGLISFHPMSAFFGLVLTALPFLITAMLTRGIGGGDVKLMAACGFVLGPIGGVAATAMSMLSLFFWIALCKLFSKRIKEPVALAPFLSIGCILAYFMY